MVMSKEEKKWQAESDANTLARAAAIQGDSKRVKAAAGAAKGMAAEAEQHAKDATKQANAIKKLANKPAKKAPAKRAAPARRAPARSAGKRKR
jgi:hypothetical protein